MEHFECLVRNPVHSAYQQDLVEQGVQCLFYKVCRVYCTRCAVCIVHGLPYVLYKTCSMYCTRCSLCIVKGVKFVLYTQHFCILYSSGPVPAGLAHRMEILSNPLKNGLIQHTFKINFVFVEKFPVIP